MAARQETPIPVVQERIARILRPVVAQQRSITVSSTVEHVEQKAAS